MATYRVVDSSGTIRASGFLHAEDAASFVSFLGEGCTIRVGARIVWTEGERGSGPYVQSLPDGRGIGATLGDGIAGESYDATADIVRARAFGEFSPR